MARGIGDTAVDEVKKVHARVKFTLWRVEMDSKPISNIILCSYWCYEEK